jgi:Protein of unknown function with HXXEE motif
MAMGDPRGCLLYLTLDRDESGFLQLAINNVQHIVIYQFRQRGYNPGLFTTMFVLMPYCTLVLWYVLVHPVMTTTDWILAFAVAAGIPLTLMSITMTRRKHAVTG